MLLKPSEVKILLNYRGDQNYKVKCFLGGDNPFKYMLLEDTQNNCEVIGKVINSPNAAEIIHWSTLRHGSINPLLNVIPLNKNVMILISPAVGRNLKAVILEPSFIHHPKCFHRKKAYAVDIILGLDYLHQKGLSLMNLNDINVSICQRTDKAIITNFSCICSAEDVGDFIYEIPAIYKPPEIKNVLECDAFNGRQIDMWACGILLMQIFTQYFLPVHGQISASLDRLDDDILRQANIGSSLQDNTAQSVKEFLMSFLTSNPNFRICASEAAASKFLQCSFERLDKKAWDFWKSRESEGLPITFPLTAPEISQKKTSSNSEGPDTKCKKKISGSKVKVSYSPSQHSVTREYKPIGTKSESSSRPHFRKQEREIMSSYSMPFIHHFFRKNSYHKSINKIPSEHSLPDTIILARSDSVLEKYSVNNTERSSNSLSQKCDKKYIKHNNCIKSKALTAKIRSGKHFMSERKPECSTEKNALKLAYSQSLRQQNTITVESCHCASAVLKACQHNSRHQISRIKVSPQNCLVKNNLFRNTLVKRITINEAAAQIVEPINLSQKEVRNEDKSDTVISNNVSNTVGAHSPSRIIAHSIPITKQYYVENENILKEKFSLARQGILPKECINYNQERLMHQSTKDNTVCNTHCNNTASDISLGIERSKTVCNFKVEKKAKEKTSRNRKILNRKNLNCSKKEVKNKELPGLIYFQTSAIDIKDEIPLCPNISSPDSQRAIYLEKHKKRKTFRHWLTFFVLCPGHKITKKRRNNK